MLDLIITILLKSYGLLKLNNFRLYLFISFLSLTFGLKAQDIKLLKQELQIQQDTIPTIFKVVQNTYLTNAKGLKSLSFYIWANAFSSNSTALNKRFLENYRLDQQFTSISKRGRVFIDSIKTNGFPVLNYKYTDDNQDILKIDLASESLKNPDFLEIQFFYHLRLPKSKLSGYGIDKNKILLKEFYFVPVMDTSKNYHHKNLEDLPEPKSIIRYSIKTNSKEKKHYSNVGISGDNNIKDLQILISEVPLDSFKVLNKNIYISPLYPNKLSIEDKQIKINKMMGYFKEILGEFPQNQILITSSDLEKHPLYGPDWLPDFINPFDTSLLWELRILHQLSMKYADQMEVDKRKNPWIVTAISSFVEYNYLKRFYPELKLTGNLSKKKWLNYYYVSKVPFTQKFPFLYLYMARMNIDQALSTPLDSLSNFNREAANPAKMALGMEMLKNEGEAEIFYKLLKRFYQESISKKVTSEDFFNFFKIPSNHWMNDYLYSRTKYNYKLKRIRFHGDSIYLEIKNKNKKGAALPLQIFGLSGSQLQFIKNIPPINTDSIIHIENKKKWDYLGINFFNQYPELNDRDNYIKLTHSLFKKPLQIRFLKDFENPLKKQIFINPFVEYNYYDGLIIGSQFYNDGILHQDLNYSFSPSYSLKAHHLSGSFSISKTHYFEQFKPFAIKYGIGGSYFHYNFDLTYKKINPHINLMFRSPDLRSRKAQQINLEYLYINKEVPQGLSTEDSSYQVWDLNLQNSNVNIISDRFYKLDLQLSSLFGKLSGSYRWRWLTHKTSQMDFRFFAGVFLYNRTQSDYFSFALDRPTDYLFQYHYYGRSESSGLFHQQFIWAEGGFKTFFDDQFANQWLISNNLNIGLWKWFNLYGDIAYKKSRNQSPGFYYDSGLRVNLVQDYFEIFFPVYSSKGFEINQTGYLQKIRLVFTIDLPHLQKMFTRSWY